ncbi:MAG: hypothetical protein SGJ17_03335 [Hyphomicrobiales bacterium]|nr:hypothetical protein [Hyphomicrobiales bacterium]
MCLSWIELRARSANFARYGGGEKLIFTLADLPHKIEAFPSRVRRPAYRSRYAANRNKRGFQGAEQDDDEYAATALTQPYDACILLFRTAGA